MFKNFFKKNINKTENSIVLIAALLIHAAKMDNNYTKDEKNIIQKALINLFKKTEAEINSIIQIAEKKEQNSNQIIEFTQEIKKNDMNTRLKIIEILWKIIYSDETSDMYESNLMRRISSLLYVSDKDTGILKLKIKEERGIK